MTPRRSCVLGLTWLLLAVSVAGGVAAQPAPPGGCAVPGQVTQRGNWEHVRIPAFPAGPAALSEYAVDPADPGRLYVTNGVSVMVSRDGGCTWRATFRLDQPPDGADYSADDSVITDLTVAPGHALLAISQRDGLRPHVVLSSYSGETWRRGDDGLRTVLGTPVAVAMTRANPGYAYLLVKEGVGAGGTRVEWRDTVYESTTGGGNWGVRGDAGLPLPGAEILGGGIAAPDLVAMAADPVEAGRLFLYGPEGLYSHQQGVRTQLLNDDVTAVTVMRAPTAAAPTVLVAEAGSPRVRVSTTGGNDFTTFQAPGEVNSFAEALRPQDFYMSAGGRVYLRSGGRTTAVPDSAGVTDLQFARSQQQVSPFRAQSLLTLYGRTSSAIVRLTERRSIPLLPIPDRVVVGNLGPLGLLDPKKALPGSLTPDGREVVLREGQSRTVPYELVLPEAPTPLDVFFDVDTTNSMLPALDGLRAAIADIIRELTESKIDVWFGVGQYKSFETPPAFQRLQDVAPPGEALADALNKLVASDGGWETQLESLRQIATGEGSDAGVGIAPGQDATWRKGSLRIVVNMTDEPISTGDNHPTYEEVAEVMIADEIVHFGIAVQNQATADALGPPLPGLIEIARHTRSYAPPQGVDCDGDEDADLYEGEPLVCVIDHASSRNASVLGGAIISVLRSLRDIGEVEITAAVDGEPQQDIAVPNKPLVSGVDFKANNTIAFDVELTCPSLDETKRFPVEIEAAREAGVLAAASATLTCKAKPEPEPPPLPPVIPPVIAAVVLPPPPPPPPLVNPGPNPNPNPNPQPQANPQPQPQGQPQGAMATQRQTQPQLATVQVREAEFRPAEARRGPTEEYALSAYTPRPGPSQAMLGLAAALVIGFGSALLALQRAELRLARQRSRRHPFR